MKVFCDTSVLVAASVQSHEHHVRAFAAVERVAQGRDQGVIAAHSLAEIHAVLTRLPIAPRIHPSDAAQIIEANILAFFKPQALSARNCGVAFGTQRSREWLAVQFMMLSFWPAPKRRT